MSSFKRAFALFLSASLLWMCSGAASRALEPRTQQAQANILKSVEYLRDPSGRLSLRDVLRPAAERTFRPYTRDELVAADLNAVHWFRFEVQADLEGPYRATLYFTDPSIKRATLFRQVVAANADAFRYDPASGRDDTVTKSGGIGLPLWVDRGQKRMIYLSLEGLDISGRLELWAPKALVEHQKRQAIWRNVLLALLGIGAAFALYGFWQRRIGAWLMLPAACTAYAAFLVFNDTPIWLPGWLGAFDVSLALTTGLAACIVQYVVALARTDGAFPIIRWWGVVCSAALLMSALLSAFFPGPAKLFGYVLLVAAGGMCVFVAIALVTFKSAQMYRTKAGLAALLAAAIAMVPRWPFDSSLLGLWPQVAVTMIIFSACVLCVWPRRAFALKPAETLGVDQLAINSVPSSASAQVEEDYVMDQPQDTPIDQTQSTDLPDAPAGHADKADQTPPAQPGRASVFDTYAFEAGAFDEMTGVLNDATILALGNKALAQIKRYERPYTAIMLRIEGYGEMRDLLGQPTSDRAAKLLAVTAMRELRESDALGRLRDDSFVAFLPETDMAGARAALIRTKANIVERTLPTRAGMKRLDVSVASTDFRVDDIEVEQVIDRLEGDLRLDVDADHSGIDRPATPPHAAE